MIPTFGSFVANGKFAAKAFAFVNALNNVDFPTFGNPTIPLLSAMFIRFFAPQK
jgi:hypothetical protein